MPDRRRQRMDATILEIVEQEGMAREIAEMAHSLAQDGHHATADMLRTMSRRRRVIGMELRANLAVLKAGDREAAGDGE